MRLRKLIRSKVRRVYILISIRVHSVLIYYNWLHCTVRPSSHASVVGSYSLARIHLRKVQHRIPSPYPTSF